MIYIDPENAFVKEGKAYVRKNLPKAGFALRVLNCGKENIWVVII
jgi:hypothetical protein